MRLRQFVPERSILAAAVVCSLFACGDRDPEIPLDAASQRGKLVYGNVCVACHNRDPNLVGPLGPEVAGASRELLEAKVLRGVYPQGYTPKSQSRAMVPLPHLAEKIDALAAYLAESATRPEAAPGASPGAS